MTAVTGKGFKSWVQKVKGLRKKNLIDTVNSMGLPERKGGGGSRRGRRGAKW